MASRGVRAVVASVALACAGADPAWAARATVSAAMAPEGYARIVFDFDSAPESDVTITNGVLVVTFDQQVDVDLAPLSNALGAIVSAARRDPDGTAVRLALKKPARVSTNEAGEALYLDLLPAGWVGLPPPLPKTAIDALTRQAREARDIVALEQRRRANPPAPLTVTGATNPTFRRLVFKVADDVEVDVKRAGDRVSVTFGAALPFDLAAARARLPQDMPIDVSRTRTSLTVYAAAPAGKGVRGFREDDSYILDVDRAEAPDAFAKPPAPVPPNDAAHAAATPVAPTTPSADERATATPDDRHPVNGETHAAPPASAAPVAETAAPASHGGGKPSVRRAGDTLRLTFPFARATPAAIFLRGDTLWAVFDTPAALDLDALVTGSNGAVSAADQLPVDGGRAVRLTLAAPRLVTVAASGADWIVSLGDALLGASGQVELKSVYAASGRPAIQADAPRLGAVRTIDDPEFGDRIVVATLGQPARGLSRARQFVEFTALATAQGIAIQPIADDLHVTGDIDRLTIEREAGLTLSTGAEAAAAVRAPAGAVVLDGAASADANAQPFSRRETALLSGAALATPDERTEARIALARFYTLRDRAADALGVLGVVIEDDPAAERDPRVAIMRASAEVELGRPKAALAILSKPSLAASPEAALWRAAAEADAGRPGPARDMLRQGASALDLTPRPIQARFVELGVTLALDAGDAATAAAQFERLEVLPATRGVGARDVLRARIAEALGQTDRALSGYAAVAGGREPAAAAEAELRSIELGLKAGRVKPVEAVTRLERLVAGWRGDWIEAEALARLVGLYGDVERWRDAFSTLQVAVQAFPDADTSRALQDDMQERFTKLFLSGGGLDRMSKLDALALFYDFKELSPGGRRGDELVRRLTDKLVDVDLLDQAAELLDYQIDNRLTGAARAQVAARAAIVDLMNNKPGAAVDVLRRTRQADLPASLTRSRLVLEARALAMSGRTDLALEMAQGVEGTDGQRVAADILWSARRWGEAGEAIETLLGSAWRGRKALDPDQRAQAMRAAVALSLAGDALGLDRIRQKFGPQMADGPDAAGFEIVTAPIEARGDAFREVARSIATSSTFDAFVREYRARGGDEPPPSAAATKTAAAAGEKA